MNRLRHSGKGKGIRSAPRQGTTGLGKHKTMEKLSRKNRQQARNYIKNQDAPRVTIGDVVTTEDLFMALAHCKEQYRGRTAYMTIKWPG